MKRNPDFGKRVQPERRSRLRARTNIFRGDCFVKNWRWNIGLLQFLQSHEAVALGAVVETILLSTREQPGRAHRVGRRRCVLISRSTADCRIAAKFAA